MKKLSILLVLSIAMLGMLTACTGNGSTNATASPAPTTSATPSVAPTQDVSPSPSTPASPEGDMDDLITGDDLIPDGNGPVGDLGEDNNGAVTSPSPSPSAKAN